MANGKKTDAERINAAERRQQALAFRKLGASYRAIGDRLGVSEAQAHRDVQAALANLAELERASAEELRAMELARLDMAMVAIGQQVQRGDLQAGALWLRISESRRKLLGLDAAPKVPLNPDGSPAAYLEFRTLVLQMLPAEQRLLLAEQLDQVIDAADSATE